jgi:hypothetical protein
VQMTILLLSDRYRYREPDWYFNLLDNIDPEPTRQACSSDGSKTGLLFW